MIQMKRRLRAGRDERGKGCQDVQRKPERVRAVDSLGSLQQTGTVQVFSCRFFNPFKWGGGDEALRTGVLLNLNICFPFDIWLLITIMNPCDARAWKYRVFTD